MKTEFQTIEQIRQNPNYKRVIEKVVKGANSYEISEETYKRDLENYLKDMFYGKMPDEYGLASLTKLCITQAYYDIQNGMHVI